MDLSRLVGNSPLKRQLSLETARRGLSHAYIISGPAGSGKRTLAGLLSAALVCTGGGEVPCFACPGCKKALAGIHPDVIWAGGEGDELNVARIRALRSDAYIKPNEAPRKVYIFQGAQDMNPSSQNALLKLLEEGPAYAAFLLLTDNAAALLPTVRSRCEVLTLSPVTLAEAEEYLLARYPDQDAQQVRQAARRCEGLLGYAVAELEHTGGGDGLQRETALSLLDALAQGDELLLFERCAALETDKKTWDRDALATLMDECALLCRDALVCACGVDDDMDAQRQAEAHQLAESLSRPALMEAVALFQRLRGACGFYIGGGHLAGWLCAALSALPAGRGALQPTQ